LKDSKRPYRIIFTGGGTGGHIYPAIAIANELRSQDLDSEILFVGAKGKMEMTKAPEYGYKIVGLNVRGLQRRLTWQNLLFPFRLAQSYWMAGKIIREFKPDAVVGTGGYASGPAVMAALRKGVPVLIQEQNSYPGLANRRFAKKAKKVCVAYEGMEKYFDEDKLVLTGNPVRNDILSLGEKRRTALGNYGFSEHKKTVLVIGGSLGARTINESIAGSIDKLLEAGLQVVWQTGSYYYDEMVARTKGSMTSSLVITRFIDKMDLAYAAADLVVSRAGALSISELCIVGKPVVFVPSPNVAEDHQTKNAKALVDKQAAIMVADFEAVEKLSEETIALAGQDEKRKLLSENISKMARPGAAKEIVKELKLIMN